MFEFGTGTCTCFCKPWQAHAFLGWLDYLRACVPGDKQTLVVNLDETSVGNAFHGAKGNIARRAKGPAGRPTADAPRAQLRGAVTHVALLTHNTQIQPLLPQILIGNKAKFTRAWLDVGQARQPPHVHLIRAVSAWNSGVLMHQFLEHLAFALAPHPQFQIILVLDTAKCHLVYDILRRASALGIWLCSIPARLTWLLQPLDVAVFSSYKAFLRREFQVCLQQQNGRVSDARWMELLFKVATTFLRRSPWQKAFDALGMLGDRSSLSHTLLKYCPDAAQAAPSRRPLRADLTLAFPGRTRIQYWTLLGRPSGLVRRLTIV